MGIPVRADLFSFNLPVIIPNSGGSLLLCDRGLSSEDYDIAITGNIQSTNNSMFVVKGPGTITISDKSDDGGSGSGGK